MLATDANTDASRRTATSKHSIRAIGVHLWLIQAAFFRLFSSELARSTIFTLETWIGPFAFDDGAVGIVLGFALMFLDEADALDDHLGLFRKHLQDLARGASVVAGNDLDGVAAS